MTPKAAHPFEQWFDVPLLDAETMGLTFVGATKVGDSEAITVRARTERGVADFSFDTMSGLLLKVVQGASGVETLLSDYKEIQGGMVPMRVRGYRGGKVLMETTFLDVQFIDVFKADEFARP